MTLIDAAVSTAFALQSSSSGGGASGGGGGGGVLDQQSGRATSSAATRLGSIDPAAPPSDMNRERSRRAPLPQAAPLGPRPKPLFSFGAIADVQYADQDDGWNFKKDHRRYYRGGLVKLRGAVDWWLKDETHRFLFQDNFVAVVLR